MQNYYKTIGALVVASAFAAGNASAEIESEIHVGYSNDYIFRGINLGEDLTEAGFDISTEYNGFGLSAGAWYGSYGSQSTYFNILTATFRTENYNTDELDLYAEVSRELGYGITGAVGYIKYINENSIPSFPFGGPGLVDDAQEVYFSLAKAFYGVDFSLTYFWDIEQDNEGYTELAASKSFELSPCLTLNTDAALGYNFEEGQLAHLTAKVALDYALTESATISPYIAHSWSLNNGGDSLYADSRNELFAGTMLSVSF